MGGGAGAIKEIPEGEAGSPQHKAERWAAYQKRGGKWDYERWSKVYENNMSRATKASAAAESYRTQIGWGKPEVTVDVEGVPRRLDIADVASRRGIEYKTGYQSATQDNLWEAARDEILAKKYGWSIKWVFEAQPSKPLLGALSKAGIEVDIR